MQCRWLCSCWYDNWQIIEMLTMSVVKNIHKVDRNNFIGSLSKTTQIALGKNDFFLMQILKFRKLPMHFGLTLLSELGSNFREIATLGWLELLEDCNRFMETDKSSTVRCCICHFLRVTYGLISYFRCDIQIFRGWIFLRDEPIIILKFRRVATTFESSRHRKHTLNLPIL